MSDSAATLRHELDRFVPVPTLMLLDFDGVVVDSEPIQHDAYSAALRPHGIPLDVSAFRRYVGSSEDVMLERIQLA